MSAFHARDQKILVVEDNAASRETMAFILGEAGYAVSTASNGLEGLERLDEGPVPDLILLDLTMPAMNGWVFCIEMQRDPRLAKIPVIVISGVTDPAPAAGFLHAAASLSKPFNADHLLELVARFPASEV